MKLKKQQMNESHIPDVLPQTLLQLFTFQRGVNIKPCHLMLFF